MYQSWLVRLHPLKSGNWIEVSHIASHSGAWTHLWCPFRCLAALKLVHVSWEVQYQTSYGEARQYTQNISSLHQSQAPSVSRIQVLLHTDRKICQPTTKVLEEHESFSLTFVLLLINTLAVSRLWGLGALPSACSLWAPTLPHPSSGLGHEAHILPALPAAPVQATFGAMDTTLGPCYAWGCG